MGCRVWVLLKGDREVSGILRGHDQYFNLVLEQAEEVGGVPLASMLVNGSQVCCLVPGAAPCPFD